MRDFGEVEVAAGFHRGEQAVEITLGVFRGFRRALEQPREESVGQKFHAVREKAEYKLIDEMRDLLWFAAPLQAQRDGRKLVRRLPGKAGASLGRPQFLGLVEHGAQDRELLRIGEVIERKFVGFRNGVRPGRPDQNPIGVAGDLKRRIFQRRRVAHELTKGFVEIALLLFVLPREEALLPYVGKTVAASGLGHAFFECEPVAGRVGLDRIVVAKQSAKIVEMRLRGGTFGKRDRLPFLDEFQRSHWRRIIRDSAAPKPRSVRYWRPRLTRPRADDSHHLA